MREQQEDFIFPEPKRLRMMRNIGKIAHFMTTQGVHTGRINDVAPEGHIYRIEYGGDVMDIGADNVVEIEENDDSSHEGVLA